MGITSRPATRLAGRPNPIHPLVFETRPPLRYPALLIYHDVAHARGDPVSGGRWLAESDLRAHCLAGSVLGLPLPVEERKNHPASARLNRVLYGRSLSGDCNQHVCFSNPYNWPMGKRRAAIL